MVRIWISEGLEFGTVRVLLRGFSDRDRVGWGAWEGTQGLLPVEHVLVIGLHPNFPVCFGFR